MATNIMAKQAQSSSELTAPQVTKRPIWPELRRTAVIQVMAWSICSVVSPWGRPVSFTEARTAPEITACNGRS